MLTMQRTSSSPPLSRHLSDVSTIPMHVFFTGVRGFVEARRPRVAVLEVADLKGTPPQLRPDMVNSVLNGVVFS